MSHKMNGIEAYHGAARPILLAVITVAAIAAAIAYTEGRSSSVDPYAGEVEQAPTGAGSTADGAAAASNEGVLVQQSDAPLFDGATDATDATGIEMTPENTVADDGGRTLQADEVIDPDAGTVNPETGRVVSE